MRKVLKHSLFQVSGRLGLPLCLPPLLSLFSSGHYDRPCTHVISPFLGSFITQRGVRPGQGALTDNSAIKAIYPPIPHSHSKVILPSFPKFTPLPYVFGLVLSVLLPRCMLVLFCPFAHTLLSVWNVPSPLNPLPQIIREPSTKPFRTVSTSPLHPRDIFQFSNMLLYWGFGLLLLLLSGKFYFFF